MKRLIYVLGIVVMIISTVHANGMADDLKVRLESSGDFSMVDVSLSVIDRHRGLGPETVLLVKYDVNCSAKVAKYHVLNPYDHADRSRIQELGGGDPSGARRLDLVSVESLCDNKESCAWTLFESLCDTVENCPEDADSFDGMLAVMNGSDEAWWRSDTDAKFNIACLRMTTVHDVTEMIDNPETNWSLL